MEKLVFPQILHLGYVVPDRDAAAAAYAGIYGVKDFSFYEYAPETAFCLGKNISDCRLVIAMGTTEAGMMVELIQPAGGKTPHADFLAKGHAGLHHVAYRVADYDGWRAYLTALPGANLIFEAKAEDEVRGSRRSFYIELPGIAEVIEITEVPKPYKK